MPIYPPFLLLFISKAEFSSLKSLYLQYFNFPSYCNKPRFNFTEKNVLCEQTNLIDWLTEGIVHLNHSVV